MPNQCAEVRRFSGSLYVVKSRRPQHRFSETNPIKFREETIKPFGATISNRSRPDEIEERAMEDEIRAAEYILQIENDAELDDFVSYSRQTFSCTINFLRRQMLYAHSASVVGMGVPKIGPADRGSIDLFWEKPDRTLLVNFPPNCEHASYYGKKPKSEISGRFDPSESRPELVFWLAD